VSLYRCPDCDQVRDLLTCLRDNPAYTPGGSEPPTVVVCPACEPEPSREERSARAASCHKTPPVGGVSSEKPAVPKPYSPVQPGDLPPPEIVGRFGLHNEPMPVDDW